MLKKDIQEKNVLWIKEIWDRYCICEETDRIQILFYGLRAKNTEEIYQKIVLEKIMKQVVFSLPVEMQLKEQELTAV